MHKCFSYPLKAENKEAFLHPGGLLGRGPQLYGRRPSSLSHPCYRPPPPHGPPPPGETAWTFPASPSPLWPCPAPAPTRPPAAPGRGKVCVGGRGMGRGQAGSESRRPRGDGLAGCVSDSSCGLYSVVTGTDGVSHQVNHQCPGAAGDEAVTPFIHSLIPSFH